MRILVYPHDLAIGGSQLNAIELAGAVSRLGHYVAVFGAPGPLVERINELGLDFIPSPQPRRRPSPAVLRALASTVRTLDIDVVHGYEWPPALESWLVTQKLGRSRAATSPVSTATVMSMAVADFLPRTVPLLVGTAQIAAAEQDSGRHRVGLLEPPVDLALNSPDRQEGTAEFQSEHGLDPNATSIVMVTRLAQELKLEGLLTAIRVVADLAKQGRKLQLVIVGDGAMRNEVQSQADAANARSGQQTIILTGDLFDPRPAYSHADIMLGMGGSALRSMAFGKPVIVQGESGFWTPLTTATIDQFLWTGWYGIGAGAETGPAALTSALAPLLASAPLRAERGAFSLEAVQRFSLDSAAHTQIRQYETALAETPRAAERMTDLARTASRYSRYFIRQRISRLRRSEAVDDFNASPVITHIEPPQMKDTLA